MKFAGGLVLVCLLVLTSCARSSDNIVCNDAYIRVGASCCLDNNHNGICDTDEAATTGAAQQSSVAAAPQQPYTTIPLRAFDYDRTTKKVTLLSIKHPAFSADWNVTLTGKDGAGATVYTMPLKTSTWGETNDADCVNTCTGFQSDDEVPYIQGGTLTVEVSSATEKVHAIEEERFSTFDTPPDFRITYDHYDNTGNVFIYRITNTGSRQLTLSSITSYVFAQNKCGSTASPTTGAYPEWVAMQSLRPASGESAILQPGQNMLAQGIAWGSVYDIGTFCTTFVYDDYRRTKDLVFRTAPN